MFPNVEASSTWSGSIHGHGGQSDSTLGSSPARMAVGTTYSPSTSKTGGLFVIMVIVLTIRVPPLPQTNSVAHASTFPSDKARNGYPSKDKYTGV